MKLAFCDCILEAASRQFWRDGKIVPLEPKMYELLEVLIQRSSNVRVDQPLRGFGQSVME